MTVTEKQSRKLIDGDGWSNPLTHDTLLEEATHLHVYADGEELTQNVDYTVDDVGEPAGYSVTITVPLDWTPDVWTLVVSPPINQPTDLSTGGRLGYAYEAALDVLGRRMQRLADLADRAFKAALTSAAGGLIIPGVTNEIMVTDGDGNIVGSGTITADLLAIASDAEAARDDAIAARDTAGTYATAAQLSASAAAVSAATVEGRIDDAETAAASAAASASTATTKASEAAASAVTASGHASTATTKAGEASASAATASGHASTATTKAGEASASAATASGHASTATTKAGEASASATAAGASATAAGASATAASGSAAAAAASAATAEANAITWRDAWLTATAYALNDAVSNGGSTYRATSAHTSGASTEPGVGASWATKWVVLAQKGATGANGSNGVGVPAGGTSGQFLKKLSGTDYNTGWAALAISDVTSLQTTLDAKLSLSGGTITGDFTISHFNSPKFRLADASGYDFWLYVTGNTFHVLVDRTGDGIWDAPNPLAINAETNIAQLFGAQILTVGAEANLTGGFTATADNDGTKSSGTYTPTPVGGNFKRIVNGGAFTLAAPTAAGDYSLVIQITNNASAGAITLSGFSKTTGDSFTTTNGDDFMLYIAKVNGFTHCMTQRLQ